MKKTIIPLAILIAAACSISMQAQEFKTFDLSSYYTPDILRRGLVFSGQAEQSANSNQNSSDLSYGQYSVTGQFTSIKNTRKLIRTINCYLNSDGFSDNRTGYESTDLKSKSFSIGSAINADYLFYNTSKQYLHLGTSLAFTRNYSKYERPTTTNKSTLNYPNALVYIGLGLGRIEDVTEAQQAVYLLSVFQKNNILNKDLSHEEIFRLAQEMSAIKNKRFLDSRLRLMAEITHVDSFFVSNKLLNNHDAGYFSNLYDIWINGANFQRLAGHQIEIVGRANIARQLNKYTDTIATSTSDLTNRVFAAQMVYRYEHPFFQKWQHSVNIDLAYYHYRNNLSYPQVNLIPSDYISKSTYDAYELNASYKLGFYPNTRTNLYAQALQTMTYQPESETTRNDVIIKNVSVLTSSSQLSAGLYYFISPQIQLSANAQLSYNRSFYDLKQSPTVNYRLTHNINIGFKYMLF